MKLSVVIPYFDETIFIRETVASCLALEDALHEIIIVNDGMRAFDSAPFARMLGNEKIQIIQNPQNLGHTRTRNVGLKAATGDLFMYLDADDLLIRESMLEAIRFAVDTHADITHLPTLCYRPQYGAWERFERDRQLLAKRRSGLTIDDAPELRYTVATWSWLFRRKFLIENDLFFADDQLRYADHLWAIEVLQAAKRISSFDQYPHIWRRRGSSMSTKRESIEDFNFLIKSIHKTFDRLEQNYSRADDAFQRDLAFFLMRLIGQWNLLHECIPVHGKDAVRTKVLEDLSDALHPYELDPAILSDPILTKISRNGIAPEGRRPIALSDLPALFAALKKADWETLGAAIGVTGSKPEQRQTENDPEITQDQSVHSPAIELWRDYSRRLNSDSSLECRLFSEYLLDEIGDARARGFFASQIAHEDLPAEWPSTMHTNMAVLARRFDTAALFPPLAGWQTCAKLRDKAAALTDAFVSGQSAQNGSARDIRRSDVLDAWRAWEKAILGDSFADIGAKILERGAEASLGDANWQAKRTIKSRIRARVIEPLRPN